MAYGREDQVVARGPSAVNRYLTGAGASGHLLDAEAFVADFAKQAQRGTKDGLLNRGIKRPARPAIDSVHNDTIR